MSSTCNIIGSILLALHCRLCVFFIFATFKVSARGLGRNLFGKVSFPLLPVHTDSNFKLQTSKFKIQNSKTQTTIYYYFLLLALHLPTSTDPPRLSYPSRLVICQLIRPVRRIAHFAPRMSENLEVCACVCWNCEPHEIFVGDNISDRPFRNG